MDIEMDFRSDWKNEMINRLTSEGIQFLHSDRKDLVIIRYITYLRKKGASLSSRQIHKSLEFNLPSKYANLQVDLDDLVREIENGNDISLYLSKDAKELKNDLMFNDWGILHLHLKKYPCRTGPLLFLYLTHSEAFLINIYEHGDWAEKSILQTIQDNWPQLLEPYIIKGATRVINSCPGKSHQELRNIGAFILIELKDKERKTIVLSPPGLGLTSSKDSEQDVLYFAYQMDLLRDIENNIIEHKNELKAVLKDNITSNVILKLIYSNKWKVIEQNTGTELFFLSKPDF